MEALQKLYGSLPVRRYEKDATIIYQGADFEQAYVIKSGVVKCYDLSIDGSQLLISLYAKNDIFPLAYVFGVARPAQFFYSAFSDVELYVVDRSRLVDYLKNHPNELLELCKDLSRKFNDLHFRVNAAGKPKAREKILHVLAFVSDRFKDPHSNGDIEITLPLAHKDIAGLAGLTRETTATVLKQLKNEKLIDYSNGHFLVHRQKIEEILWG